MISLNDIEWILAPMDGVTDHPYRNAWMEVFGNDPRPHAGQLMHKAVSPFVSLVPGEKVKRSHIADLLPQNNLMDVEPQVLGNDAGSFLVMAKTLADLSYRSVNWNLGCPKPQIASKQRGSGLLPHPDRIDAFLSRVVPASPLPLSVKIRLGYRSPDEVFKVIDVLNRYPLVYVAVHPRIGTQLYGGEADWDRFGEVLRLVSAPCTYNGDIDSLQKAQAFVSRFGKGEHKVKSVMIGRGVIADPFLPGRLAGLSYSSSDMQTLFVRFVQALWRNYLDCGLRPLSALQRQKLYWSQFRGPFLPPHAFTHIKTLQDPDIYDRFLSCF